MKFYPLAAVLSVALLLSACHSGGAGTAKTPDGEKINLTLSPKGSVSGKTKDGTLFGQNNEYSFYGIWQDDAKLLNELRYQGTKATHIQKSGSAIYKGNAVWVSPYDKKLKQGGITTLYVDFGEKTVEGDISFSNLNNHEFRLPITLHEGKLSGADFAGQASVFGNNQGHYEGALFGPGGKEAAGMVQFDSNHEFDVSFGGQRQ